ncbi:MAG TPA: Hsp20/alpha crystallin family protein [Terriglobia bacterium]|nr:Hsp20/alpha crystallin family protein [Terriglobia bacterium]
MSTETKMAKSEESKSLAPKRPFDLFSRWEQDLERMFDDVWYRPFWGLRGPGRRLAARTAFTMMPLLDVYEEKEDVVVKAELPGLSRDDIDVNLTGSTLTIRGEKKKEEDLHEDDYYYCERSHGSFSRSIELPAEVKADQIKATFKDGILQIRFPKTEEAKRKSVSIKVA